MMNKFYIMIGNIGSGKSTYIKNNLSSAIVISKDSIRYAIGGGKYIFDYNLEPIIHATSMFMTNKFCEKGIKELVLDESNIVRKNRKQFIEVAKKNGYEVIAIMLPRLDKDTSIVRRLTNPHGQPNKEVWEGVWDRFNKKYQEPILEEGFDKIINLTKEDVT